MSHLYHGYDKLPEGKCSYVSIPLYILVGGAITILKNMKVNGKDDIPYIMENKKCSKPPTRLYLYMII